MSTTYATVAELRTHPGMPASGQDALLQAYLDAAAGLCDTATNSTFAPVAVTELHCGRRSKRIRLRKRPVISVTSVSFDGSAIAAETYALVQGGWLELVQYGDDFNPRVSWDEDQCYWPQGTNNIQVIYQYGYSAVPSDVNIACRMLAAHLFRIDSQGNVTSKSMGPVSKSFGPGSIPVAVKALLSKYVQVEVGT